MLPLHGVGVLVTRPELQALPLCRLLEAQGARARSFPAIEIHPLEDRHTLGAELAPLERFDLIVFTSANAVRYGAMLLGERRDLKLAAIGPATAHALNQAGYRVAVQSAGGYDSEALLRHPSVNSVAGARVLLVKGQDGRELLREELTRRGARVTAAEVYRRESARPSAAALSSLESEFAAGAIQLVTATSVEIARSLLALATEALRRDFERCRWLVPGARVAESLRALGLTGQIVEAASALDQDLLSAVLRWRAGESGA